jgi:hypothetical protein
MIRLVLVGLMAGTGALPVASQELMRLAPVQARSPGGSRGPWRLAVPQR